MNKIFFHDYHIKSKLPHRKVFKTFLVELFKKENIQFQRIDIIFCTDEYLLSLNTKFLFHNSYTDTMTFILQLQPLIGEIYISSERVKENSRSLDIPYNIELTRIILHGCLHLCGYKDKSKYELSIMYKKQEAYLKSWLVSRETQNWGLIMLPLVL